MGKGRSFEIIALATLDVIKVILVWTTSCPPALGGLFVCVCVCPRVRGHDPISIVHDKWLILLVWPTSYETQSGLICIMQDGAIHYKLYLLKLTMAVDNCVFRIIKGAF